MVARAQAEAANEKLRARARLMIAEGLSDIERWSKRPNLKEKWDARAKIAAALIIGPNVVLDVGCGAMALEKMLPSGSHYIPADIIQRDHRTILFDMNKGDFPNVDANVVFALGLLEYAHNPAQCMNAFARWPRLIISYNPVDLGEGRDRLKHGWFNNLTTADVIHLAREAGFSLSALIPCEPRQKIFDFLRDT